MTNKRFINLGDEKLFDSIVSFFSGNSFKRAIELNEITCITYSEVSNEFILHVPKEYDYRLRSPTAYFQSEAAVTSSSTTWSSSEKV